MPDVWSMVTELDETMQERLADVLETRGADRQQQELRRTFLDQIAWPNDARVLEVGCGTGVLARALARRPEIAEVVGVDLAPSLLIRARALAADMPNVSFQEADARSLPFPDGSFDVVVFDSTLSHVSGPEKALAEAYRVLRPLGWLAAFDGDYSTTTVALGELDPLQRCVDAMVANSVTDRWLVRRLPALVRAGRFEVGTFHSYGFVETTDAAYMLTVVDRGIDILRGTGADRRRHGGRPQGGVTPAGGDGNVLRAHFLREPHRPQALTRRPLEPQLQGMYPDRQRSLRRRSRGRRCR